MGVFNLFILVAILIVIFVDQKNRIDAQLFKRRDFNSTDINKSWESFKKELGIQDHTSKIENIKLILEREQIYSIEFDLIDWNDSELTRYRYRECLLCKEGERDRELFLATLENKSDYSDLMNADHFFKTLNLLKKDGILKTMDFNYKMIAADGHNEEVGVEGDYYALKNNRIHRVQKSSNDTDTGYYLHVMGNNDNEEFGTSEDSITIFLD